MSSEHNHESNNLVIRFGVSLNKALLDRFDKFILNKNYLNRSEAIRDLLRNAIIAEEWENPDAETVATLTLLFNHHSSDISDKLAEMQHEHHSVIISSLHVHLDHENCLEVIVLRGQARSIKTLAESLLATKGVRHGGIVRTSHAEIE